MGRKAVPSPEAPPLSPLEEKPAGLSLWTKIAAVLIIAVYVGLGAGHIYSTPVASSSVFNYINAPDEAAHVMYVRAIAEGHRFPVRGDHEFPTYEWHQPPLYYQLISPLYAAGPIALRWGSLVLGTAALALLFLACRVVFPSDPSIALLALAFAAFLPMREATTAAVGNDGLLELLFTASVACMAVILRDGVTIKRAVLLGLLMGAAIMTKASGLLLLGVFVVAFILMRRSGETWKSVGVGAGVTLLVTAAVTLGWFARSYRLYHELTPAKSFMKEFEGTMKASDIMAKGTSRGEYLAQAGEMTFQSFFAAYTPHPAAVREGKESDPEKVRQGEFLAKNGIPVFMPLGYYVIYGLLTLAGLFGAARALGLGAMSRAPSQRAALLAGLSAFVLVLAGFVAFIWTFFQTQGRYLYPAMLPISALVADGARAAMGARYREVGTGLLIGLMFLLAAAFLYAGVQPAYQ